MCGCCLFDLKEHTDRKRANCQSSGAVGIVIRFLVSCRLTLRQLVLNCLVPGKNKGGAFESLSAAYATNALRASPFRRRYDGRRTRNAHPSKLRVL